MVGLLYRRPIHCRIKHFCLHLLLITLKFSLSLNLILHHWYLKYCPPNDQGLQYLREGAGQVAISIQYCSFCLTMQVCFHECLDCLCGLFISFENRDVIATEIPDFNFDYKAKLSYSNSGSSWLLIIQTYRGRYWPILSADISVMRDPYRWYRYR